MNTNEYLSKVLAAQSLTDQDPEVNELQTHRQEIEDLIYSKYAPTIRYGGSRAKGTMIRASYDLDLPCYFSHDDTSGGETLKDIFGNISAALQTQYTVVPKNSALRVYGASKEKPDLHIDVVPGRFIDDSEKDAFLYCSSADKERQKTNLDVHIKHVRGSGVREAIKLMKYWRFRNSILLKHFVLELLVIDLLKNKKTSVLADQLIHVWTKLRDEVEDIKVEDPANPTGNDLCDLWNDEIKKEVSAVAKTTLDLIDRYGWQDVFGPVEEKTESVSIIGNLNRAASAAAVKPKPWACE